MIYIIFTSPLSTNKHITGTTCSTLVVAKGCHCTCRLLRCWADTFSRILWGLLLQCYSQMIHVWYIYLHLGHIWGKCSQIFHTWIIWDFNISNVTSIYLMLRIYTLYTLYTSDISYHILSRCDTYAYGSNPCVFEVSIDTLDLPSRFGSSWKTWLILPLVVRIHKQPRG